MPLVDIHAQNGNHRASQHLPRDLARVESKRLTDHEPRAIIQGRYESRLAANSSEIASALRLRHAVFNVELSGRTELTPDRAIDFDAYDLKSRHLIVIDRATTSSVGTYRLNTIETVGSKEGFYSSGEFTIEDLPADVLHNGVEIGRACVARDHRNTKVLYLLWTTLLRYLEATHKRYFFGCCSLFTTDERVGAAAYRQLSADGCMHPDFLVSPRRNRVDLDGVDEVGVELPALFNMYLRLGAKVCGPPMIDREFGTIDFFVVLDIQTANEKYRRMFSAV